MSEVKLSSELIADCNQSVSFISEPIEVVFTCPQASFEVCNLSLLFKDLNLYQSKATVCLGVIPLKVRLKSFFLNPEHDSFHVTPHRLHNLLQSKILLL
jgi:hypothetical protein